MQFYIKYLRRNWVALFTCWIILCSSFSFGIQPVFASSPHKDPKVLIAIDETGKGCTVQVTQRYGTPQATKIVSPCLPATLLQTKLIPRSQAIAQHRHYLVLPTVHAQGLQFISTLRQAVQPHIPHPVSLSTKSPSYSCGYTIDYLVFLPGVNGNDLYTDTRYYVHSDCQSLTLDFASVELESGYANSLYWWGNHYFGSDHSFTYNCSSVAPQGHTYTFNINQGSFPVGRDFLYDFRPDNLCLEAFAGWFEDIGTLSA